MSRHSKNSTATHHFTYAERQKAGHGTLKRRFGKDSQLPFGHCALSLQCTKGQDAVVSPSGYLYLKECIYSNLLAQKQDIQANLRAYDKYKEKKEAEAEDEMLRNERADLAKFLSSSNSVRSSRSKGEIDEKKEKAAIERQLATRVDTESREDKLKELKRTSFWAPGFEPSAEEVVEKPREYTVDPLSGKAMKMKHLMDVKFTWSDDKSDPKVLCALTKKEIVHQQAVLLKPSGQVILESCLKDMVLPTMRCPISSLKLRKKDIICLQKGGSSFSAHSNVEAKKYRPNMT